MTVNSVAIDRIPRFDRDFFGSDRLASCIGRGEIGGKASGLLFAGDTMRRAFPGIAWGELEISIPRMVVITTEVFDAFMVRNDLYGIAYSDAPDHRIAHAFQQGEFPPEFVDDLRGLVEGVHSPLAVRSSSLLEDALFRPFAGVYHTKMTPNNQPDRENRFRRLVEAVKLVWASTFFAAPKRYIRTTDRRIEDEKMAVLVQEAVGRRHGDRFYPDVSGVARSYNFYPASGTEHDEGVVNLALGLGKQIVDGGLSWFYPPARPRTPPPFGSTRDQLEHTQTRFWAVNMGEHFAYDPVGEEEYLVRCGLEQAEADGSLRYLVSTYDPASDRLTPGLEDGGARVLNFAPLLSRYAFGFNHAVSRLLQVSRMALGGPVEIEFATTLPRGDETRARLGFLQVRPMLVEGGDSVVSDEELARSDVVLASSRVIGNGTDQTITDIVYVCPGTFDASVTREIAAEIERINGSLVDERRPYLLIGFGRWGTSEPWLGIPVSWDKISGARVIVEATLPTMLTEMSQGSHFFHNLTSFKVSYLMVSHHDTPGVNWDWLEAQPAETETAHMRHLRLSKPLLVMVDGVSRRGVIRWGAK
ncbi:MAG: hypothetical protein H6810_09100 [Phycisphaeraceae bacterium]|nr:MAG: hypothetical protein H6810_09100 [Phycisphaeraceae bacterium]